jgi:quercetin dioxygenase-like cupin family protein
MSLTSGNDRCDLLLRKIQTMALAECRSIPRNIFAVSYLPAIRLFAVGLAALTISCSPLEQQSGIKRTKLQRHDLSPSGREVVQVRIDFEPGKAFGKHSHRGEEIIYVLEGLIEYEVAGKPPVTLKAGDVLFIPAGTIHAAKNAGTINAAGLATYIVVKGR